MLTSVNFYCRGQLCKGVDRFGPFWLDFKGGPFRSDVRGKSIWPDLHVRQLSSHFVCLWQLKNIFSSKNLRFVFLNVILNK